MSSRACLLTSTIDFGRPYKDIVDDKGTWTMEEWLHWALDWSVGILQPYTSGNSTVPIIHDTDVMRMWTALRHIVLHFMRPFEDHAEAQEQERVAESLKTYSCLVEKVFGPRGCSYNLHLICCR